MRKTGRAKYYENSVKRMQGKAPVAAYLYPDGTAMFMFRKNVNGTQVEWAEVHQNYVNSVTAHGYDADGVSINFEKGRVVFHEYGLGALLLAKGGDVEVSVASVKGGSDNTKSLNLRVGHLSVYTRDGIYVSFDEVPDVLSSGFTIQFGSDKYESDYSKYNDSWESLRKNADDNYGRLWRDTPVQKWIENPKH